MYLCRHVKPGGWIEIQDFRATITSDDATVTDDHPANRFWSMMETGLKPYGFDIYFGKTIPQVADEAGFTNIQVSMYKIPVGVWPQNKTLKVIGYYFQIIFLGFIVAILTKPAAEADMSKSVCDRLLEEIREAFNNPSVHAYVPLQIVCAQKPK